MSRHELMRIEHLTKISGGIKLLDDFSLMLLSGEHMQITGLSGSGLETLGSILAGQTCFDAGNIIFDGISYGPGDVLPVDKMKIFSIYDRSSFVPHLTVAENIFITRKNRLFHLTPSKRLIFNQSRLLTQEFGMDVPPNALGMELTTIQQMSLEFIKAYARSAKLIVAHGVAGPYPETSERLFAPIKKKLRDKHISIISLSTNPFGMFDTFDRTIVMRDGSHAKTIHSRLNSREDIMKYAVSGELPEFTGRQNHTESDYAFRCRDLSTDSLKNLSFNVHKGEIVGLFDSDSDKLCRSIEMVLTGSMRPESGNMWIADKHFSPRNLSHSIACGLGYINGAKLENHLIDHISVLENVMLPSMKKVTKMRIFCSRSAKRHVTSILNAGSLSGLSGLSAAAAAGDDALIKATILFYRWDIYRPKLLLYSDPFANSDAVLRLNLAKRIERLTSNGIGVLVLSPRLRDLALICDRILIYNNGRFKQEHRKKNDQFCDLFFS